MANEKRLIDAYGLLKRIKSFEWRGVPRTLNLMFAFLGIIISGTPTVDAVEVVHGKWVMGVDDADYDYGVCSVCGYAEREHFPNLYTPNYCPDCGAKMDGGNEDG